MFDPFSSIFLVVFLQPVVLCQVMVAETAELGTGEISSAERGDELLFAVGGVDGFVNGTRKLDGL